MEEIKKQAAGQVIKMDEQSREWYVKEIIRMLNETDGEYIRKIYLILKHHKETRGVHNGKTQN